MPARRLWLQVHRWLALSLGVPLALVALLGAALTVAKPLDRWANAGLFRTAATMPAREPLLEPARQAIVGEFGAEAAITFRPPRETGDTLWAMVKGPWHGTLYFDPASGRELGRRGEHEGWFNLLFELHSALLMGEAGKPLLAALALAYLVLLASGLVLWWPARWAQAWRVELRRGPRRALFDLHRAGGSLIGLLLAVAVASGAYMAWRPLSGAVTALAGVQATRPPALAQHRQAARPAPLDEAVRRARALLPGAMVGYVQVPAPASAAPLRVRLKLPEDPHPNGLSSVWLHPHGGAALRVDRWNQLDPGSRAYSVIYPLHSGELGGTAHTVANALLGMGMAALAGSGWWLWWRRRQPRQLRCAGAERA